MKRYQTLLSISTCAATLRLNGYPKQLLQYASFALCDPDDPDELPELAASALKGNAVVKGIFSALPFTKGKRGTQGEVLGGDAGEIAVREMLADLTSEALNRQGRNSPPLLTPTCPVSLTGA